MKKSVLFLLVLFTVSVMLAGTPATTAKIEVFYFHFTRRCMTCQNLEKTAKKAVETLYADKLKKGEISFQSINLDEKAGEEIGTMHKVEGQTLLVTCGDKRVDLTEKGFLYANNDPDKLTAEIKKAIDGMVK
ncbi:MAG: nitrophenyl compound nitroreductase subunit ArsF family protein [Bacteroidetes bacterium]|nr:nitrophenyl compound nitroreductase subunit ArsF family protein [Bacteroidota bacterium]